MILFGLIWLISVHLVNYTYREKPLPSLQFKFASRLCEEWNRLDGDTVAVGSMNAFKMKLDHHLINAFLSICFFLLTAIHGNQFFGSVDVSWYKLIVVI